METKLQTIDKCNHFDNRQDLLQCEKGQASQLLKNIFKTRLKHNEDVFNKKQAQEYEQLGGGMGAAKDDNGDVIMSNEENSVDLFGGDDNQSEEEMQQPQRSKKLKRAATVES